MISENLFLSEPAYFSGSDQLGEIFLDVQNCPKKLKNLHLIKFISKWNVLLEKGIRAFWFLIFGIWNACQSIQH